MIRCFFFYFLHTSNEICQSSNLFFQCSNTLCLVFIFLSQRLEPALLHDLQLLHSGSQLANIARRFLHARLEPARKIGEIVLLRRQLHRDAAVDLRRHVRLHVVELRVDARDAVVEVGHEALGKIGAEPVDGGGEVGFDGLFAVGDDAFRGIFEEGEFLIEGRAISFGLLRGGFDGRNSFGESTRRRRRSRGLYGRSRCCCVRLIVLIIFNKLVESVLQNSHSAFGDDVGKTLLQSLSERGGELLELAVALGHPVILRRGEIAGRG